MQTFSFKPTIQLLADGKSFVAVTSFEATNSVFKNTNENNSFSITIPGHWQTQPAEKTIDELNKPLEFKSQKGIKSHVKEVRKRGNQIKLGDNEHKLSDFDTQEYEIPEELKNVKYNDLEDLVYRFKHMMRL